MRAKEEIEQELKAVSHEFEEALEEGSIEKMKKHVNRIETLLGELSGLAQYEYLERLNTK